MKASKKILLTLLLSISFYALSYGIIFSTENSQRDISNKKSSFTNSKNKNVTYFKTENGKTTQIVDLPTVTIFAERAIKKTVPVTISKNETIATVDLPEVLISAKKTTTGFKLRNVPSIKGFIASADLPEVLIVGKRYNSNFSSAKIPDRNKILAVQYKGSFIPYVFLPVDEINANTDEVIMASDYSEKNSHGISLVFQDLKNGEAITNKKIKLVFLKLTNSHFIGS